MSVELCSMRDPGGNHESVPSTTVGGSKPLHRFLKGQPKTIGVIVLILGASLSCNTAILLEIIRTRDIFVAFPPTLLLGVVLIASGIMYILTEHKTTKKTVTASLALSILSVLLSCWLVLQSFSHFVSYSYLRQLHENNTDPEAMWPLYHERIALTLETVWIVYSFVGGIIGVVMTVLAGAALRSTKSQVIVMMTATPSEMPAEYPAQEETLQCSRSGHEL